MSEEVTENVPFTQVHVRAQIEQSFANNLNQLTNFCHRCCQ